jgi:hypothetical protein
MLLTHGARSVLRAATVAREVGRSVDGLRTWAMAEQGRINHNKAACALANNMARICYATLRDQRLMANRRDWRRRFSASRLRWRPDQPTFKPVFKERQNMFALPAALCSTSPRVL